MSPIFERLLGVSMDMSIPSPGHYLEKPNNLHQIVSKFRLLTMTFWSLTATFKQNLMP